jgi:hypothetical protein
MRLTLTACGVLAIFVAGCGDNSKQCGKGTNDLNGDNICEPDGEEELICGDGTVLDTLTLECVPSDTVCGGGTVLIDGQCKDPTGGLVLDLEEGPEPNGFEVDATSAGTITLKANGEGFVLHGCVKPVDDTPDLDVYDLTVTGPTLIEVTADGVEGLSAGFMMFGDAPQLANWFRLGINVATDTSKRQLFLPVAGRYELVLTDTRTLLPITQNGEGFPAAGNPDGTSCYYVTVAQRPIPSPQTLDLVNGNVGTIGSDLKFFTATFPTGFVSLSAVIDPEDLDGDGIPDLDALGNPIDSRAASSIILMNNDQLRQIEDAGNGFPANTPVSAAVFAGIKPGDNAIIVLDYVWNYKIGPADFAITVEASTTSQPLPLDGSTLTATSNGKDFFGPNGGFDKTNQFHWDVTQQDQIDDFDITFSIPVQGSIVDQDGNFASPLTGLLTDSNGTPVVHTFTSYKGLIRNFAPGRYYFFLITPRNAPGTTFTVTSTIETQTPVAITRDTPTANIPFNAFNSHALTYNGGTEPWHLLNGSTTGASGNVAVSLFDPANTTPQTPGFAFGRLDTMVTTLNAGPPSVKTGDGTPLVATVFNSAGTTPIGAIFKNPFAALPAAPSNLLVTARSTVATPTGTFKLDFQTRVYENFGGGVLAADAAPHTDSGTITAGSEERYYVETAPGNRIQLTVTPNASPGLNIGVEFLDIDESVRSTLNATGAGAAETTQIVQGPSGFTAFRVRGGGTTGNFDLAVTITPGDYTITSTGGAAFSNACLNGGVQVPLVGGVDEGVSAAFAPPAGFTLFGDPITDFKISANGFITFNTSIADAAAVNTPLQGSTDQSIAPFWDDLDHVVVCMKSVNGKRVIQWTGEDFSLPAQIVQFQAILDPSNDSIEFVYGPAHQANGVGQFDEGATIGIQKLDGSKVLQLGFDEPLASANLSIKLVPN